MGNNKNKWFLSIFLSILCLTFLLFLLNAAPLIFADLPPLDSGNLPFSPLPGAYAPPGGGFFPQYGAPYGLPYQNQGLGFMPPAGQFGVPYQNQGLGFMPPAGQFGVPYQNQGLGFMPPAGQFGIPYQSGLNPMSPYMPTGAPYGFPAQAPLYNIPPSVPYGPINPYVPPSSDTSGTNTTFPVYNTGYNPATFPNQGFFGPAPNMYAPTNFAQPFPGVSAYDPAAAAQGFINPAAGFGNPFVNPYGNMSPFPGAFPQQGFPGGNFPGYNPFQPVNPWQQPWSPYGTNINLYNPYNPYQPNIPGYNPGTYYPSTGGNGDNNGDGGGDTVDIPNIEGHWAGTWEAWATDPNGLVTDPNGQTIISMSGDIIFHITDQKTETHNMSVSGTIEITGWNIDPPPQDWTGDWTGESDEIELTGWISKDSRWIKARYYYYPGKEEFGDYDINEDYKNIKGLYTWDFNSNQLNITDTGISGNFKITGEGYYEIGLFSTGKYIPQ